MTRTGQKHARNEEEEGEGGEGGGGGMEWKDSDERMDEWRELMKDEEVNCRLDNLVEMIHEEWKYWKEERKEEMIWEVLH